MPHKRKGGGGTKPSADTGSEKKQRGVPFSDETYGVLTQLRSIWGMESIDEVLARLIAEHDIARRARDLRREARED